MSKPPSAINKDQFESIALRATLVHDLPVFPCNPDNKRPLIEGGVNSASSDPSQIMRWGKQFPHAMVGLACGRRPEFFILDIDLKPGEAIDGYASLAELERCFGALPQTMRVLTPGSGTHIYFKLPAGVKLANRAGDIAPGLDIRSDGGYGVAPGSARRDGVSYELRSRRGFGDIEPAPEWLLFLAMFGKRRRGQLAKLGINGPSDFEGLPVERWETKARELLRPKPIAVPTGAMTERRAAALRRYVMSSIRKEITEIEQAAPGTRDNTINTSTLLIWSLIKGEQAQGLGTADLEEEAFGLLVEACAGHGEDFDEDYARDKWERCGADAAPRDLNHLRADPLSEFGDVIALRPDMEPIKWPFVIEGRGPDPKQLKNVTALLDWLGVVVRQNIFSGNYEIADANGVRLLDDASVNRIWAIANSVGLRSTVDTIYRLVLVAADACAYHPVRDYLKALSWDGVSRIDRWLPRYVGATDDMLNQEFSRVTLIAGVRRVMEPGCKFDHCLVIEGPQNAGKSSVAAILGGSWFGDGLRLGVDPKMTIEATRGRWVVEIPELSGMMAREVEAVKAQITTQVDRARPAYGRVVVEVPRQFILIGTTNDDRYLRDRTGNRRFLPVKCGTIDLAALRRDRDQLWAEAYERYRSGEATIRESGVWADALVAQEQRVLVDPLEERLVEILDGVTGEILREDLWRALGRKNAADRKDREGQTVMRVMKRLGWQDARPRRESGTRPRVFQKSGPGGAMLKMCWSIDAFVPEVPVTGVPSG